MAPWRVLGIDKCGSLRSPQPSTRHGKANREMTGKPNRKRGGAEPSPLNRFGDRLPLFRRAYTSFYTILCPNCPSFYCVHNNDCLRVYRITQTKIKISPLLSRSHTSACHYLACTQTLPPQLKQKLKRKHPNYPTH